MKTTVFVLYYNRAGQFKVSLTEEMFEYFLNNGGTLKETCIHFSDELGLSPKEIKDVIM